MSGTSYVSRVAGALSRLINVMLFNGHPSESLSARTYREWKQNPWRVWVSRRMRIFFWDQDHCKMAYKYDFTRAWERVHGFSGLLCPIPEDHRGN